MTEAQIQELMTRARAGDEGAQAELLRMSEEALADFAAGGN